MKKLVSSVLVLCMIAVALAGCGNKKHRNNKGNRSDSINRGSSFHRSSI